MIRKIVEYPNPILSSPATAVTEFGPELEQLVQDMFETMTAEKGIGLAANQVGVGQRVLVVGGPELKDDTYALVNPKVLGVWDLTKAEEGCLSLPGLRVDVTRPEGVQVEYQTVTGRTLVMGASGLLARAILHEIDHLNGVMIIDHVAGVKRTLLMNDWRKMRKQHNRNMNRMYKAAATGRGLALRFN